MGKRGRYSPEVRGRAIRMVFDQERQHDSQSAAIQSIAEKIEVAGYTVARLMAEMELAGTVLGRRFETTTP